MDFEQVHYKRSSSFDETFRLYLFFIKINKVILKYILHYVIIILHKFKQT